MYWQTCVLSVPGKSDEALAILARALESGIWWHPHLLAHDPDLKPLQESEAFKKIIKLCQEKLEKNKDGIPARLFEYGNPDAKAAIFSLHWRNANVEEFASYWLDERPTATFLVFRNRRKAAAIRRIVGMTARPHGKISSGLMRNLKNAARSIPPSLPALPEAGFSPSSSIFPRPVFGHKRFYRGCSRH